MRRIALTTLAVTALIIWASLSPGSSAADEDAGAKARELFVETHKCQMCHGVAAVGIEAKTKSEKMKGIDLSGYKFDGEFETLAAYARKEADLEEKTHKKEFKGTDEELQTILDWLGSLEAQE